MRVDQGGSCQDRAGPREQGRVGFLGRGDGRGKNQECDDASGHGEWAVYHPESAGLAAWSILTGRSRPTVSNRIG